MSRHDGRETDGAHGHGAWLPGGYAAEHVPAVFRQLSTSQA